MYDCTSALIIGQNKIQRNYLFMTFLSNTRFYLLQIKGKKDTTVIFIERQNISLGQRINSKLIFRLQLADIRREKEGLNGGGGGGSTCRLSVKIQLFCR